MSLVFALGEYVLIGNKRQQIHFKFFSRYKATTENKVQKKSPFPGAHVLTSEMGNTEKIMRKSILSG